MENRVAFIGHRLILEAGVEAKLYQTVKEEIDKGTLYFTMGTHGEFDELALKVCRELRTIYKSIKIEVVVTSLNQINYYNSDDYEQISSPYRDVETVMYEIEDAYFKRRITLSNKLMIDNCDTLICFVDENAFRSGAKTALNYAKSKGLKIINLYGL